MTDSENSQPQDDSDEDIYKDIPEFNFEEELAKLEGSKESYKQEANDLSEKVKALTEENKELKKSNEVLKRNLSSLLKTAQAEVQRKDSLIEELRSKVESFTFKRNRNVTKDKYTSTEDLDFTFEVKFEPDRQKSSGSKIRSKSYENQTGSDSERKLNQSEDKWKESSAGKEENLNCDNDRKSDYYRDNSKTNFRHSESSRGSYDRHREKKSSRYEDSSGYKRSYRENHRDHLKYDSFDKKRHSRSSDNRFLPRRRSSRERRGERRRSSERRRRAEDSPDRSRRRNSRKERSWSRENSRGSKESSLEKGRALPFLDKDSDSRIKEQISGKSEKADSGKGVTDVVDCKKRSGQENDAVTNAKSKEPKEKRSGKQERRSSLDIFSTKSPLDALYNDMITSRKTNRLLNSKSGANAQESDLEEGELSVTQHLEFSESQPDEDWTLSFKNERQNDTKPITLYSRRMMRKFSAEMKTADNKDNVKEEKGKQEECKKVEEVEKEPGELTDDENIIESSKEFQELAKVASIQSEIIEKATFKEPVTVKDNKVEVVQSNQVEIPKEEKLQAGKEDQIEDQNKDCREVIEFSPFKNNYKLIEISPIKPKDKENVLDFYNKNVPPQQTDLNSSEGAPTSEQSTNKPSDTSEDWKNSSSEKESETELKIVIPPVAESQTEKESEVTKKVEDTPGRGRRRTSKKETEKPSTDEKTLKRKRGSSEGGLENCEAKKRKVEKSKSRKDIHNAPNPKTELEPKPEVKAKEDITTFEFFKPVAKADVPRTPADANKAVGATTDYKMTATMSVTGVVRLETPNKCVEKLKNLMFNEQMIFNVLDSKSNSQFSPLIASKSIIEMTPRRMLKNDLMLTDSEDDSVSKRNAGETEVEAEEMGEEEEEASGSGNSECDSDSGASDFVDLL